MNTQGSWYNDKGKIKSGDITIASVNSYNTKEGSANANILGAAFDLLQIAQIVKAISDGDRKTIESFGFDFSSSQQCSDWVKKKLDAAINKAKGV